MVTYEGIGEGGCKVHKAHWRIEEGGLAPPPKIG